jgi:hypothetical protein
MARVLNKLIRAPGGYDVMYSGEVDENGLPHGFGEWLICTKGSFEGQILTGVFVHGYLHGLGKVVTADGDRCAGRFIKCNLEGPGLRENANGARYSGQFKNTGFHGFGTSTYSDGGVIIGCWAERVREGIALLVAPDGSKAAVTYKHGEVVSETSGLMKWHSDINGSFLDPQAVRQREKEMSGLCVWVRSILTFPLIPVLLLRLISN